MLNNKFFWATLQIGLLVVALGLVLAFNYNTFDPVKDPRAMIIMAILSAAFEGIRGVVSKSS